MKPRALIRHTPDKTAIICAWCPDKEKADEQAEQSGYDISHTICPTCKEQLERQARSVPVCQQIEPMKSNPILEEIKRLEQTND